MSLEGIQYYYHLNLYILSTNIEVYQNTLVPLLKQQF